MTKKSRRIFFMFYDPTYCCNCGEKIERTESLPFLKSGRFCDVCQKEFSFQEWMPTIFIVISGLVGLFGIGTFLRDGEPAKPAAFKQTKNIVAESNVKNELSNTPLQNNNRPTVQQTERKTETNTGVIADKHVNSRGKNETVQVAAEKIYFCGAATKKGTPCSRKVKGGGRCWQHIGQEAILPQEKLLITQ